MRALPEPVAAQAEAVRRTTAPAPDRAAARPDPETTTALVQACSDHRRVRLGYRSEAGSEWVTEVDPWAVVVRHGRWYLLCRSHPRGRPAGLPDRPGPRRRSCSTTPSAHPPTSTRSPMLEEHLAVGWEYDVEVVIDAPLDAGGALPAPRARAGSSRSTPRPPAWSAAPATRTWYAEQLAAIPASYRIVRCPELQQAARGIGQRLLAASEDPDQPAVAGGQPPAGASAPARAIAAYTPALGFGGALERLAVDLVQPELVAVAEDPLEVVEQRPVAVAEHRDAVVDRVEQPGERRLDEGGAQRVVGRAHAVLGHEHGHAGRPRSA